MLFEKFAMPMSALGHSRPKQFAPLPINVRRWSNSVQIVAVPRLSAKCQKQTSRLRFEVTVESVGATDFYFNFEILGSGDAHLFL
jgi:hypothetical protein